MNAYGFTEYLTARRNESINLDAHMLPPADSTLVFMGCGNIWSDIFDIGIILTPDELFEIQEDPDNARPVKNFFVYHTSGTEVAMGHPIPRK